MNQDQIKALQKRIGTEPDGFWGPKSIRAVQAHLRGLMPQSNPWPDTSQDALTRFYGSAGDESRLVRVDVPSGVAMRYDDEPVTRLRCHERVAESLIRVLKEMAATCPKVMLKFDGCFNNRPMRGGSLPSLHARGAAVDFASGSNGNLVHWPVVADMPLAAMEAFSREGWLSAGAFWGRDAMHFQATR